MLYTAINSVYMEGAASSGDDGAYLNACTAKTAPCMCWMVEWMLSTDWAYHCGWCTTARLSPNSMPCCTDAYRYGSELTVYTQATMVKASYVVVHRMSMVKSWPVLFQSPLEEPGWHEWERKILYAHEDHYFNIMLYMWHVLLLWEAASVF